MLKLIDDGNPAPPVLHASRIAVRWGDQDADGHVNNATVLQYLEEARMQWVARLGLAESAPGLTPVVASLACEYVQPIGYPASLYVGIGCAHLGNSSLQLVFEIRDTDASGELHARACAAWVWVDAQSKRPHPMPEALRRACSATD